MKIYSEISNINDCKVLIAAAVSNSKLEYIKNVAEGTIPSYLPRKKYPILEVDEGVYLFSPNEAARYVFGLGSEIDDNVEVDQWLEWEATLLQPTLHPVIYSAICQSKVNSNSVCGKLKQLNDVLRDKKYIVGDTLSLFQSAFCQSKVDTSSVSGLLRQLNDALKDQTYIVGDKLSVADIVLWSCVYPFFYKGSPLNVINEDFPAIANWFALLSRDKNFSGPVRTVMGDNTADTLKAWLSTTGGPPAPNISSRKIYKEAPAAAQGDAKPSTSSEPEGQTRPPVTPEEIEAATETWLEGSSNKPRPKQRNHPLLPIKGGKNILITSALPYVNNVPHLGNIIGCVLSADVYSRFCRLRNYNSIYICGTDEYGTATETKAVEEGLTPQQICDKYNALHREIYDWFNIDFDYFGRTTTKQHTAVAQDIFTKLNEKGFILRDSVEQLQCEKCDRFLADRFVEGTCPMCAYEDARGDQCDKCGKLVNAVELIKPRCKMCSNTPVVKSSDHLFMDLPKLEPFLQKYLDVSFEKGLWTNNSKVITKAWIRDGLKPRCISRDLKWGIPIPLEGYTDKVFYVWFDAPIGYISITANYTDKWEQWWKNPDQVEMFQFMAKDNVPFHSVIFPCALLGCGDPYVVVNNLSATEYLNYEDGKFSKSRGVGVFGNNAKDTGIPSDIWRFYLLYIRPENQDTAFNWDDFVLKNNSELLNNIGNFINRALMFVSSSFGGKIPKLDLKADDYELVAQISRELKSYVENLEKIKLRDGIRNIMSISKLGNQYMQSNKPWVLVKGTEDEKTRAGTVVGFAANIACLLSVLIQPYMPATSKIIQEQLNAPNDCNTVHGDFVSYLPEGHAIGKPKPLFQKIDNTLVENLKKQFQGKQDQKKQGASSNAKASPEEIEKLTKQVTDQGNKVRELKTSKAEKSVIDEAVVTLLSLKKQLAVATGETQDAGSKKKKGGKDQPKKNTQQTPAKAATPAQGTQASPQVIEDLTKQVTAQGEKVRELKAAKAEKSTVDAEVATLLNLKRELAIAQGQDPDAGGKKKKGKK